MKRSINIRLEEELRLQVEASARADGNRSMNSWLLSAVQEKLARLKNEKPQTAPTVQGLSSHYS